MYFTFALTDLPELQDLSVRSVYRRRGIATALTRAAEHEARGLGFDPMRLSVIDGNEPACEIILPLSVACRARAAAVGRPVRPG